MRSPLAKSMRMVLLPGEMLSLRIVREGKDKGQGVGYLPDGTMVVVNNAHAAAVYVGLTGHDRGENGGGTKPGDHPAIGSVLGMVRPPRAPVPPFVSMPYITQEGRGGPKDAAAAKAYYQRAADLGDEDAKKALKRLECPFVLKDKRGNLVSNLCF